MSKSFGNQIGITDPPAEMYGKTLRIPDELARVLVRAAARRRGPGRTWARATRSAPSRARSWSASGATDAAAEAEAGFDRVFIAHELPDEIEEVALAANGGTLHLPEVIVDGLRGLALGGAAQAGPGRRQARRRAAAGRAARRAGRGAGRPRAAARQAPVPAPADRLAGKFLAGPLDGLGAPCYTAAPRHGEALQPAGGMTSGDRCARLRCPLGSQTPERAQKLRRNPLQQGAAVFENSTACTFDGSLPSECVQVSRCRRALPRAATGTRNQKYRSASSTEQVVTLSSARSASCVPAGPRVAYDALCEVLHGEFDPGSGRTLAACLTHASGATNQGLPWGRAANG